MLPGWFSFILLTYWGNGDGRFIYPPAKAQQPGYRGDDPVLEGPVSSIRWEMLREGIEDYEFLYLLRSLLHQHKNALTREQIKSAETLLEVPRSITSSMTGFTTDPGEIYNQRKAVAEAIEDILGTMP